MKYQKKIIVTFLALFLFAVHASNAYATDWARLMNESSEKVYAVDYYDDDTGAFIVTNASGTEPSIILVSGGWENRVVYQPTEDGWYTKALYDVEFVDENTVIAIGEDGTIVKTEDFGDSWQDVSVSTSNKLLRLEMYSATRGWIVGENGSIYKTTDGGDSWTAQTTGVTEDLNGVYFLNWLDGYIVGDNGTFLVTTTGGTVWNDRSAGGVYEFNDVYFASATYGLVATSHGLLYTTDGGSSWATRSGPGTSNLSSFDFYSSSSGAVVGTSVAYTTKNQGASWTEYSIPDENGSEMLFDVEYSGDSMTIVGVTSYAKSILFASDDQDPSAITNFTSDSPSTDSSIALSWSHATDNIGIESYEIDIDGAGYSDIGYLSSYSATVSEGSHDISIRAVDIAGNTGEASTITVIFDRAGPIVSAVTPISATQGSSTSLSITSTDALSSVSLCTLYLNGASQGAMTNQGSGVFTKTYTFTAEGSYTAYAICVDSLGNSTTATSSYITVGVAVSEPESPAVEVTEPEEDPGIDEGDDAVVEDLSSLRSDVLIKSQCVGSTDVNDPCRAVYYYDSENRRHAFPNEKVFFTWYDDFDDIIIIDSSVMAEISLSTNVTYHPGTKMVKFQTINTVYAVEQGGVLRAIASESIASSLYGSAWNTHIDDISDAFFRNYSFGDDINSASDYSVADAIASVSSLDDNF
ncbi:MAG: YCF48-related protein [Patescibacteria group bacterium]